jgi:hypothetical protein
MTVQVQVINPFTLQRTNGTTASYVPGLTQMPKSDLVYNWTHQHVIVIPASIIHSTQVAEEVEEVKVSKAKVK